ncbi:winged helix-turn-helix domain-containing protein [Paenirhodobacter populi]|uniref:winged helix-turn-helix domain-containing protein n=1 Tax=Paenirhodobacter populi TaxID=2306993 RepID=UPI0019D4C58A|nr:winged helix-turn-helix domain-containing protein [Sinirhodobacter populi]
MGDLSLDTTTRQFRLAEAPLALIPRENAVLEYLILKAGRTVTKSALSGSIFGLGAETDPSAIEIYVHRSRKKIDGAAVEIAILRGLG